jgi:hypothetical protein
MPGTTALFRGLVLVFVAFEDTASERRRPTRRRAATRRARQDRRCRTDAERERQQRGSSETGISPHGGDA